MTTETTSANLWTTDALLEHWQGHRRLTRRVIEAFPEDKLFQFSVGGMRPFAELASEFIGMGLPSVVGIATGQWKQYQGAKAATKTELLNLWDTQTVQLNEQFPKIAPEKFTEVHKAFGQWVMTGTALLLYCIDNEIHHRGQGYVYLRALGIEPPPFWDRN